MKLTGNLIKLSWAPGAGGVALSTTPYSLTTRGFSWDLTATARMHNTTPEQSPTWEEYTPGTYTGTLTFRCFIDSATAAPPIPDGVLATATLYPNYTQTGKYYAVSCYIESSSFVATSNTGGQPEIVEYRCQVSWNGTTAAIAPTTATA